MAACTADGDVGFGHFTGREIGVVLAGRQRAFGFLQFLSVSFQVSGGFDFSGLELQKRGLRLREGSFGRVPLRPIDRIIDQCQHVVRSDLRAVIYRPSLVLWIDAQRLDQSGDLYANVDRVFRLERPGCADCRHHLVALDGRRTKAAGRFTAVFVDIVVAAGNHGQHDKEQTRKRFHASPSMGIMVNFRRRLCFDRRIIWFNLIWMNVNDFFIVYFFTAALPTALCRTLFCHATF